jgi:hypothetical protein
MHVLIWSKEQNYRGKRMSVNTPPLSVILPVHNAAASLVPTIQDCLDTVPRHFPDYEIIIVDDGSSDMTPAIADNLAANYAPIMVVHHLNMQGYGRALLSGVSAARGCYILLLDVEGAIHPRELAQCMPYLGRYDIITGYRASRGEHQTAPRTMSDALVTTVINSLLRLDLREAGCHFDLFRAEVLHAMRLKSHTALICLEIYQQARQRGASHIQVDLPAAPQRPRAAHASTYARIGAHTLLEVPWVWGNVRTSPPAGPVPPPLAADAPDNPPRTRLLHRFFLWVSLIAALRGIWMLLRRRKTT